MRQTQWKIKLAVVNSEWPLLPLDGINLIGVERVGPIDGIGSLTIERVNTVWNDRVWSPILTGSRGGVFDGERSKHGHDSSL
jgi:hypothetical protein